MGKGYKQIGPDDGVETRFKKGQIGNPYGRPRRLVSQVIKDLKDDGVEAVTASQVSDIISVILNLPIGSITKIAADKDLPIIIQKTAERLQKATESQWDQVLRDNLDRAHGRPLSKSEITGKDGENLIANPLDGLSIENKAQILRLLLQKDAEK